MMEPPAFEFIEVEDGQINRTFSFGNRVFQRQSDNAPETYAFSVHKDSATNGLQIAICSPFLRQMFTFKNPFVLNFQDIAPQYSFLKATLCALEDPNATCFSSENAGELRLLIEDFFLDRYILTGIIVQNLYDEGFISQTYWQDLQHQSAMNDLKIIDDAFQGHLQSQKNDFNGINFESRPVMALDHAIQFDEYLPSTEPTQREDGNDVPSEKYHVLKAIRHELDKLKPWHEGWENPSNLDDCLHWRLDRACQIDEREQEFLDQVMSEMQPGRRINALICHSGLEDDYSLHDISIFIEGWAEHKLDSEGLYLAPTFRSVSRPSKYQKRQLITARLHAAFKAEHRRFRAETIKLNIHKRTAGYVSSCRFTHKWYYKAWDKGIATIRRLLQGKRPDTLEKICRLLQVAYAMGSQDPSNTDFRETFVKDLDRWRTIVPLHSLQEFDAIVGAVWNKTFEKVGTNPVLEYGSDEQLVQLQELLSGLISHCPLADMEEKEKQKQQDEQLYDDGHDFTCAIDITYAAVRKMLCEMEDPRAYPDIRKLPICLQPASSVILLLMVGAIFGFIVSFFLVLQSSTIPTLAAKLANRQHLHFANFEEKNLYTLSIYMGLSLPTVSQEGERHEIGPVEEPTSAPFSSASVMAKPATLPAAGSQTKSHQLKCGRCSKQFSNLGNLNRHTRYDCDRKARFQCRNSGCRVVASRKAYRDKHEVMRCPFR